MGQGNSGIININVGNAVVINDSAINSVLLPGSQGDGGDVNIKSQSLSLADGASIQAFTSGNGFAGNIDIRVNDFVSLTDEPGGNDTQITTAVNSGGVGDGGTISIQTQFLYLTDGSQLMASTFTGGEGQSGSISVHAEDSVNIDGPFTGFFAITEPGVIGSAGTIRVISSNVHITNAAEIAVDSEGEGPSGDIDIRADNLILDNQALISAETSSQMGGNISIDVGSLLLYEITVRFPQVRVTMQ